MRWDGVHIAATGVWLPGRLSAAEAVAAGAYDADEHAANRIASVTAAETEADGGPAAPEMAVRAARTALRRAGAAAERVSAVFHSYVWFQGADMWAPASYVADGAAGSGVPAFGLQQSCNAGVSSLELGARQLEAGGAVLLTTADRFSGPSFDRWRCERGLVYGDAGTALVLSSVGGFARLLSTSTAVDNSLEAISRPARPVTDPSQTRCPLDLSALADDYVRANGDPRRLTLRTAQVADESVRQALADADTRMEDVSRVVLNATGRSRMRWQLELQLGLNEKMSNWEFCSEVGHLGAGDHCAGLDDLVRSGQVLPGDRVLLVGGGTGYSCTSAVVEITETPRWSE
ncbi:MULTISPECIES: 3-oxoacyl-[acyl-carrier-protein] synthase III C-terminal domain-containing protein [Streptomyces]|uniref:3-oxoacyl-[acyl-carrier-protein] synthase III C-terminal domain-containing protein n=1 Tax=Streptomyces TaxID=1883 RepID=UPI0029AF43F7|nr:3-oxoacyl-[acyl-carrier-protein] synthase III C-terminal domain-containing protein [Streptomyces sp. WI03-4A]MDX2595865.1 3-oxoacyl-[acyl-carrier-protein] synthase III C-terminal domain-containing protein [Streptomyces sp. WI03-4A]